MQELREGLKKLLEQRREVAQKLSDLDEQIEHVNKALGVGNGAKARKPRGPNKKKAVDGQPGTAEDNLRVSKQAKQVDFTSFRSEAREP